MAEQVQKAVDEQQAALVGEGGAEARGLGGDVGRREHDVAELARLARSKVGVVGALALEAHDVGRAVVAAPLEVCRGYLLVGDDRDRDVALAVDALMGKDGVSEAGDLLFGKRELEPVVV